MTLKNINYTLCKLLERNCINKILTLCTMVQTKHMNYLSTQLETLRENGMQTAQDSPHQSNSPH